MSTFHTFMNKLNPMKKRELNLCPMVRIALAGLTMGPALVAQEQEQKKIEPEQRPEKLEDLLVFKVPSQPLASSLSEIATHAQVYLSFDKALVEGIQAPELQGKFTISQAFQEVLKETNLRIVRMKNGFELLSETSNSQKLETIQVLGQKTQVNRISSRKFIEPLKSTQTSEVIGSELIEQQGLSSIKDVLRNSPGITFRAAEGGAPSGDNLFIRGLSATNDIFLDGMRNSGEQSRDAYNLEQIEVFKGPNSSNFGRGSAGGAINLVTKTPQLDDFTTLTLGMGTHDYWRGTIDSNYILSEDNGIALRFNAMYSQSEVADRAEIESKSFALNPTLAFGLGTNLRFNISYEHFEHRSIPDNGIPTLSYSSYERNGQTGKSGVDDSNYYGFPHRDIQRTISDKFNFGFEHDYDENWTFSNQTSLQHTRSLVFGTVTGNLGTGNLATGSVSVNNSGSDISIDDRTRDTEVISLQNQTLLTGDFETGPFKHNAVFGLDVSWEEFTRYETTSAEYSLDGGVTYVGGAFTNLYNPVTSGILTRGGGDRTGGKQASKALGAGLYFGDTVELNRQWSVNGLGRIDYYKLNQQDTRVLTADATDGLTTEDWLPSWKIGLNYKPMENGSIYLGIGNSINPPSANATNGFILSNSASSTSNSGLEPIETRSIELGTKWEFFDSKLNISGTLFRNDVKNDLTLIPGSSPAEYLQTGKKRIQGISLSATGQVTDNWTILFGYTYLESKISSLDPTEDGENVPFLPQHSATLWSQHRITDKFSVGLGAQYSGKMNYDTRGVEAPKEAEFLLWNAMASYQITDKCSIQMNINNIFDEDYIAAGSTSRVIPGNGRSVLFSLCYEF